MGRKMQDLTGQMFGGVEVVAFTGTDKQGATWECRCSCGATFYAYSHNLKTGHTKSCGCLRRNRMRDVAKLGRAKKQELAEAGGYRYYKDNPYYDYKD